MAALVLTENTAAELLAMRLVLQAFMNAPDGTRPTFHRIARGPAGPELRALHHRAGLEDAEGARLLAGWSNRGWWSPTPSYLLGTPTESGIVAFAKFLDAMDLEARRTWWAGLTEAQALEILVDHQDGQELPGGDLFAVLCPACSAIVPFLGVAPRACACGAPLHRKDREAVKRLGVAHG